MKNTNIEWTDHSWNPWRGCTKVSPGCMNCYAEEKSKVNPGVLGKWGKGAPRVLAKNWGDPLKWNKEFSKGDYFTRLQDQPRPERPKVFPSFCDWLDDEVPIEWLARFLNLIHDTPNIDWLLLTKRPENWEQRLRDVCGHLQSTIDCHMEHPVWQFCDQWLPWNGVQRFSPPANVWIGASIEDQKRADERIPALLDIPAILRFLSVEPLLGPIEFSDVSGRRDWIQQLALKALSGIDWVIVGGESGPRSRPCNVDWIRSIVKQCAAAKVPCFVKQLGANCVTDNVNADDWPDSTEFLGQYEGFAAARAMLKHPKGGDPAEWPTNLRIRQYPEVKK